MGKMNIDLPREGENPTFPEQGKSETNSSHFPDIIQLSSPKGQGEISWKT